MAAKGVLCSPSSPHGRKVKERNSNFNKRKQKSSASKFQFYVLNAKDAGGMGVKKKKKKDVFLLIGKCAVLNEKCYCTMRTLSFLMTGLSDIPGPVEELQKQITNCEVLCLASN